MTTYALHRYPITIRESHLDTFGHVNNATYLELFEEARWELITSKGYGMETIRSTGLGPVILDITIKFRKELRLRAEVIIETQTTAYGSKIGKLRQQMVSSDGTVFCEADFTVGLFDLTSRKLVPPTPEWLTAVGLEK